MPKHEAMAAEHRRRAAEALEAAAGTALTQVRAKLRSAAEAWLALAEMEDRRVGHANETVRRAADLARTIEGVSACA